MIEVSHKKLGSMSVEDIVGSYKAATITHFDGNIRQVYYTDNEVFFNDGEQVCSCTDTDGYITMANSAFVRLSGYSKKELIGLPHYVLYHPDMPHIAFKDMWTNLKTKGRWQGYVKNLRKDGGFYWVFASIFSNYRNGELVGYTSSRLAADRDKIELYSKKYAEWLRLEQQSA